MPVDLGELRDRTVAKILDLTSMTPELKARQHIDHLLEQAGWIVQDYRQINIFAGPGVAVREFPLTTGAADYMLYVDGKAIGVVEAKPKGHTLVGVETQSGKYLEGVPSLPDGWRWATAEQICSQITDGEHIQPPYQVEGFPILTATHVRNGHVEFKNVRYISESDFRRCLLRCAPTQGDILIVSVGATTSRAGIVQQCDPFALVRSVLLLKAIKPASFLLHWIQSPWCQSWIGRASGATAQAHFYISDTKRMPVSLPPENEQSVIVDEADRCLSIISVAENQIEHGLLRVSRLRQSILKQAFEGMLVPQDPKDESADVMLGRLRVKQTIHERNGEAKAPTRTRDRRVNPKQLDRSADK